MREYARITPGFWIGETGRRLRGCPEGQLVALYLMTSPYANMLGLYYLPKLLLQHETGLTANGVEKGMTACIRSGFCDYDESAEVVWVFEMARYQSGIDGSKTGKGEDLRMKGIQNEYNRAPDNRFLAAFYEKYAETFKMTAKRGLRSPLQAPCKPLASPFEGVAASDNTPFEGGLTGDFTPSNTGAGAGAGAGEERDFRLSLSSEILLVPKKVRPRRSKLVEPSPISEFARARGERWDELQRAVRPNSIVTAETQMQGAQSLLDAGYTEEEIKAVLQFIYDHRGGNGFRWFDQVRSLRKLSERPEKGSAAELHHNWFEFFQDKAKEPK